MRRIAELWNMYAASVLPPNVSAVQRQETRRAFYAGAGALFGAVTNAISDGLEVTDADVQALEDLRKEIDDFSLDVGAGKA